MAAFRLCLVTPGRHRDRIGANRSTDDIYCSPLRSSVIFPRQRGNELCPLRWVLNWDVHRWDCRRGLRLPSLATGCIGDAPHIGSGQWLNKWHWQASWFCSLPPCSPAARLTKRSPIRRHRNLAQLSREKKCPMTNVMLRVQWDPATWSGDSEVEAPKAFGVNAEEESRLVIRFNSSTVRRNLRSRSAPALHGHRRHGSSVRCNRQRCSLHFALPE